LKLIDLLGQIENDHISRVEFGMVGLAEIQQWVGINPLVEALFVFQNNREHQCDLDGLETVDDVGTDTWTQVSFPIECTITPSQESVQVSLTSLNSAVSESMVRDILTLFKSIVSKMINSCSNLDLNMDVKKLFEIPNAMRDRVFELGTGDVLPIPYDLAHQAFENIAREKPDLVAVEQGDKQISYGELDRQSTNLSYYLIKSGVKNGDFVPLVTSRSFEMVIGMLAILKAGAAYIPIDNSMPVDRIMTILQEAGGKNVLLHPETSSELLDSVKKYYSTHLMNAELLITTQSKVTVLRPILGTDPSYVVFTSGSTGKPKGVILKHQSLSNWCTVQVPSKFAVQNRWANVMSINFDATTSDIFSSLSNECIICLRDGEGFEVVGIVDSCLLTPSMLKLVNPKEHPNLKQLVVAGELFPQSLQELWCSRIRLINAYGPSETTIGSSVQLILSEKQHISIGKPLPNTVQYIVNSDLELVPVGVSGELIIGGVGVAKGYLGRPDLTDEKFIPNHFLNDGTTMYKTGDICRWLENGEIEILGRADDMVKVNGYRIELNEVRDNLEHVESAEVLKVDNKLVAFVTPKTVDLEKVLEAAMEKLPHYMIPSVFVPLDKFPLTGNGKVKFKMLTLRLTKKHWQVWIFHNTSRVTRVILTTCLIKSNH
jgi:amino acid adenylation domain-containing protein